jgi:uncharacterized protein YjiS (DUF1127 family)
VLVRWAEGVVSWNRRRRDRRLLAGLDDQMLRDIGMERAPPGCDDITAFRRSR